MMRSLPVFYYRQNFQELLAFVVEHYGPVLSEARKACLQRFESLPSAAQCLYIRLLNRQGTVFEMPKLRYPELGELTERVDELQAAGFVRPLSAADLEDVLACLSKASIVNCASDFSIKRAWTKSVCIEYVIEHVPTDRFLSNAARFELVRIAKEDTFEFCKFLYFGRITKGTSPITLRDLGVVRASEFEEFEARFESQKDAEAAYFFAKMRCRLRGGSGVAFDSVVRSADSWPRAVGTIAERSRDKLALALARKFESIGDVDRATEIYRRGGSESCLRSACRLLSSRGRTKTLRELLESHIDSPRTDSAYQYAIDALDRYFNAKPRSAASEFLKKAESLELDEYYRGRPEYAAARYYESRGTQVFRTENELWLSLFGLLFWDLLFESTRAYSPFEGLPSQLINETFYISNKDVIEQRLRDLSDSERSIRRILQSAMHHHGARAGVFRWRTRTINAIQALVAHAPPVAVAAVLRRMSQSFNAHKKGYPDLMLIEDGEVAFVEVKTPADQLRSHQLRQIIALNEVGFPTSVVKIEWVPNPQQAYVVVDVETTGGRSTAHRVTEIGAVKIINGQTVDCFSTLINPDRAIPAKITRLTGIRNDMVASAPRFSDIAKEFAAFLDGSVFCAHNVNFDYGFLREEFARVGHRLRLPKRCTCTSMRQKFPGLKSYALNALCREFDIPLKQHHRALCDAQAAAELLLLTLPEHGSAVGRRAS